MTEYTSKKLPNNTYAITAKVSGNDVDFLVSVSSSEDEIPDLVEFFVGNINKQVAYVPNYKEQRQAEYPSIGDQLDALFHAGVFPSEMADKIKAIKDKYPKV